MSDIRFSVVVPTCSRDDALAICLEALRPEVQGVDADVIVTDDGTQASTSQLIASRFPFARWSQGPRRGPAANRNNGASLARGDFIVFIDDDVVPSSGLLAAYRAAIEADVNVYEGRTTCVAGIPSVLYTAPANETGGFLWSCNMMVRRTFWQSFGGFDEDFRYPIMEDVAFRERLKAAGERFKFVREAVVDHPPRRMPSARARIRVHDAHFLYYYKYLGRRPSLPAYFAEFANYSLRPILARRPSWDSVVALGSRCREAWYVLRGWREWDRKYAPLASDPVLGRIE